MTQRQFNVAFTVFTDSRMMESMSSMSNITTTIFANDYVIAGEMVKNMHGADRTQILQVTEVR